jgi:hypothetical protein
MSKKTDQQSPTELRATIEEVNRVLEVGRLLLSVLTQEELEELQNALIDLSDAQEIGNAGVT